MDLGALADFNAVVVHGGFGAAARALDRPKATLSRRVADLEQSLGVRLLERGARQIRLTEEGEALHQRTHGLMAELGEAVEVVTSQGAVPRGRLRVSAPFVFAHLLLARAAAHFALAYPQVTVDVVADDRLVDPVADGFDVVIRVNPSGDERLVGRRIFEDALWVVAAPGLALPTTWPDDAVAMPVPAVMLSHATPGGTWQMHGADGAIRTLSPQPVLRVSTLLMAREAVLAGAAIGRLPKMAVRQDVRAGRLRLLGTDASVAVEIWALYSTRRLLSAKVRAFIDMLQSLEAQE
ncbi:LysR family transcriptional regulator [Robbsia sp. KACC 23696]|uniref:LysR family transcriptional regulator n=1 Tax=Robbsia sp. KACC 23696 TaxID=3149231 RepID=UPI00325ADC44